MNVTSIDNVYFKDDSTGLEETSADIRNRHSSYDVWKSSSRPKITTDWKLDQNN